MMETRRNQKTNPRTVGKKMERTRAAKNLTTPTVKIRRRMPARQILPTMKARRTVVILSRESLMPREVSRSVLRVTAVSSKEKIPRTV